MDKVIKTNKQFILDAAKNNKTSHTFYIRAGHVITEGLLEEIIDGAMMVSLPKTEVKNIVKRDVQVYFRFQGKPINFSTRLLSKEEAMITNSKANEIIKKQPGKLSLNRLLLEKEGRLLIFMKEPDFLLMNLKRIYERINPPEGIKISLKIVKNLNENEFIKNGINVHDRIFEESKFLNEIIREFEMYIDSIRATHVSSFSKDTIHKDFGVLEKLAILHKKFLYFPFSEAAKLRSTKTQNEQIISKEELKMFLAKASMSSAVNDLNEEEVKKYEDKYTSIGYKSRILIPVYYKKLYLGFVDVYSYKLLNAEDVEQLNKYVDLLAKAVIKEMIMNTQQFVRAPKIKNISASGVLLVLTHEDKYAITMAKTIESTIMYKDGSIFQFGTQFVWENQNVGAKESYLALSFDKPEGSQEDLEFAEKLYGNGYRGNIDSTGNIKA